MIVHFGRRHHHTRARLPDFTPDGRIEIHEPNLSTRHQTNSASSALPNSPITSSSSPASAILLAASAQPVRAALAGRRNTSAPSSIVISAAAFASRPNCASTGFGMTTPWELPICRMLTCIARMVITMLFRCGSRVRLGSRPQSAQCPRRLRQPAVPDRVLPAEDCGGEPIPGTRRHKGSGGAERPTSRSHPRRGDRSPDLR